MAMNIERPHSSTASVSSSTTLRPRNRRRTNEEGPAEDSSRQPTERSYLKTPSIWTSSSRPHSPVPHAHPSRPWRTDREQDRSRSSSRFLDSQASPSTFWESSWSSLSNFTSTLIGNDSSRASSPARRRGGFADATARSASATPVQWGPSGDGDKQLGVGTMEDRRTKMQAERRKTLLQVNGNVTADSSGRYKRRGSDDRISGSADDDQDRDALVYLHRVKAEDTLAGVTIKYGCDPNIFRKANRLWPNDTIQIRKEVVLPVDACSVKGCKVTEPDDRTAAHGSERTNDFMPTITQTPWGDLHSASDNKVTPISSIPTSPSISVALSNPEEPPWKHDSWVTIDGFVDAVEIARLSRRSLGYFPRSRRKSATFSDLDTPSESLDLHRRSYPSSPPRSQATKSRSSSASYFAHQLQGPGGVGTMGKNVHSPGPAQDGLNKLFAAHLPNLAPQPSSESLHSSFSQSNGIDNIGGAVEGWVRKLATKAASTVQPSTPGGKLVVGDLIELSEDAFEFGKDDEDRQRQRDTNAAVGVWAWSAGQERGLRERLPSRGSEVDESSREKRD